MTKFSENPVNIDLPILRTERLILRMFEPYDIDEAEILFNDADVQRYLLPENRRDRNQLSVTFNRLRDRWRERGFGMWCVAERDAEKRCAGYCGFQIFDKTDEVELLFAFQKHCWSKGFATEAARGCLTYGFETLNFKRVYASTVPENAASRKVLEKAGFKYIEENIFYGMNSAVYLITREDYFAGVDAETN